jgi:hypothetical protein
MDEAEEPRISYSDTEPSADQNSMCDREDNKDAEQVPEKVGEETVRRSLPKSFTKSQGDAKDEAEEPRISHSDTEPSADQNSMCDREDNKDAEQEPEKIGEETVRRSLPKSFTKSQCKTTTFSYPGPILPSDDSEDERSTPRRRISRIRARSKYLRCIQKIWPSTPSTHNAMSAATTGGCGST